MPNYTDSLGFYKNSVAYPANGVDRLSFVSVELDFAKVIAARAAAGAVALAANDTLQVIHVPAGSLVLSAGLEVLEAESTNTTADFDLGFTGGDVDAFVDGHGSDTLGFSTTGTAGATFVSADDTIDLLLLTAVPTDAKVRIYASILNCND